MDSIPEFDPEQDDLHSVATKLGVENHQGKDRITPTKQQLLILNRKIDDAGNTILIKFAEIGKSDVLELLLKFEGINVNHENEDYETAAKVAKDNIQPICLLKLLEADSLFPGELCADDVEDGSLKDFLQKREDLHEAIANGNLEKFMKCLGNPKPSIYLNNENESALYVAAENRQVEIYAHLISIGARFRDQDEEEDSYLDEAFLEKLNDLLEDQFLKIENYELFKLLHRSKSPQPLTEERYGIVKGMYDYLGKIQLVRLIMKVLEYEDVDIVFDFENVHTNNVYCKNYWEVQGLTVTPIKRIFIAAKKCLSTDGVCKEVAGVLAHELCHMAIETLYKNDAKPYVSNAETIDYVKRYESIVETMSEIADVGGKNLDEMIKQVFKDYPKEKWSSELIVRVPHILAAYGEEEGRDLLQTEAKDLYFFYMNHIFVDSKGYSDPKFYKKALCGIESIHSYYGCISEVDKETSPLRMPLKKYANSLIKVDKIHLIITNIVRLCALNIYHQMKFTHRYRIDRKCLFLRLEVFKRHEKEILKAFSCSVCRLMVLICNGKYVDIEDIKGYFCNMLLETKEVIVVVSKKSEILDKRVVKRGRCLDYLWKDLSEPYKMVCLRKMMKFKCHETSLQSWIKIGVLSKILDSEDLMRVTTEETMMIEDGKKDDWKGYRTSYYIHRELAMITVDISFVREPPASTAIYITGLRKEQLSAFDIDDKRVHWLNDSRKGFDDSKQIFIREEMGETSCSEEFDWIYMFNKHWYHYSNNKFHLISLRGKDDSIYSHLKRRLYSEKELIETSLNRIILISDDPGTGKSTLLSSLLRRINEHPHSWVARINLNDHAVDDIDEMNSLSLEQIKPNMEPDAVLDIFFRLAGFKSNLDIHLMKQISKTEKYGNLCKVFLDGYDEVSSCYKENVMKLFEVLIMETRIQIWITTRVHERIDLEVVLGTCAFSLVQFSEEKMIEFLDKLWKHSLFTSEEIKSAENLMDAKEKLKGKIEDILSENDGKSSPLLDSLEELRSELEDDAEDESWDEDLRKLRVKVLGIDFKPFAYELILRSSIKDEEIKFTGIPLHLFMVGSIAFQKNLKVALYSDLYELYSEFVEGKIRIYWREKERNVHTSQREKSEFLKLRKRIYSLHIELAKIILKSKKVRNIDQKKVKDEDDLGVAVGILTKCGDNYQFIHRTFAEFFFAEWVLREMNEKILMEVMFEVRYDVVRTFLSSAIDGKDTKVVMRESFKNLNMVNFFKSFLKKPRLRDASAVKIFRKILLVYEEVSDECTLYDFTLRLAIFISQKPNFDHIHVFKFLCDCLPYKMLADLFGVNINYTGKLISIIVKLSGEEDLREVIETLENVFFKRSLDNLEGEDVPCFDDFCGSHICTGPSELTLKLALYKDEKGFGFLHSAAFNGNENAFSTAFKFLERILDEEEFKKCLLDTTNDGSNIMHCSAMRGAMHIKDICFLVEGKVSVIDLLTAVDISGKSVFHVLAEIVQYNPLVWLLDFLNGIDGGVTLKNLLFLEDNDGKTMFHYVCVSSTSDRITLVLQHLRCYLDELELKELIKRRDKCGKNVFHFLGMSGSLDDICIFEKYLSKDEVTELFFQVDFNGNSCLHLLLDLTYLSTESLKNNLITVSKLLGARFKDLLGLEDRNGMTFFQCMKDGLGFYIDFNMIFECFRSLLPESDYLELMNALHYKSSS